MKIPLFPLDLVLFPGAALPLHIFEPRYKEMIGSCLQNALEFGVVRARRDGLAVIGCTASVLSVLHQYPDGRLDILCHGARRFEVESLDDGRSYLQAEVDFFDDTGDVSSRLKREQCAALHMEMLQLSGSDASEFPQLDLDRPVAFLLATSIPSDLEFKQELLGMRSDAMRTIRLIEFYETLLPKLRRGAMVSSAARNNGHVM
ncbi:MAG TPA: LON peptidase substrate-binding domain-containing protein [Acidobacteriaceae bacterium]|jgi:Lon protease-like protein|nr:LON peptidase substrate-binding domain-containing protein [Acidobacteriaceae bacterium]